MTIVIIGDGKVGKALTEQLAQEGHDLVIIDNSSKVLQDTINSNDVIGVHGNGASYLIQKEAGVENADMLISATSSDELNLLCCLVAKKIGAKHTIARVRNPEYSEQIMFLREDLGLSMVINPELAAANEISRMLRFPSASKIDTFARGRVDIVEIKIEHDSPLAGQKLSSLYEKYQVKILVCAVQRQNDVFIPNGDFVLMENDKINITASPVEIASFFKALGIFKDKVGTVLIVGGSKIAYYLTKQLTETGILVKIIEQNQDKCFELSEKLPKSMIIHGDGTDHEVLLEEGIERTDAFVSLTGIDEENIILSMYANSKKVNKVITKINRLSFTELIADFGIDSIIVPKNITANQIVRYVRAMQGSLGSSSIETLHRIVNGKVEALEFHVSNISNICDIPLKDLQTKNNLLIACIIRNNKIIIPNGNDSIKINDNVIVVTTNHYLNTLDDILV